MGPVQVIYHELYIVLIKTPENAIGFVLITCCCACGLLYMLNVVLGKLQVHVHVHCTCKNVEELEKCSQLLQLYFVLQSHPA